MKSRSVLLLVPTLLGSLMISSCATAPKVDPAAQALLDQTTEKLRAADTVQVSGTRVEDPGLLPPGSKGEHMKFELAVVRPESLAARTSDEGGKRHLVAGNGGITMYSEKDNVYTTTRTEAKTIDGLVDDLEDQFDVKMTIGELLGADPLSSIMEDVTEVKVGGEERVNGTLCTRLDFTQKDLYWHLWIAKSDALPRKSQLTYTKLPGQPNRVVTIERWKLGGPVPQSMFSLPMKKGAQAVEVIH